MPAVISFHAILPLLTLAVGPGAPGPGFAIPAGQETRIRALFAPPEAGRAAAGWTLDRISVERDRILAELKPAGSGSLRAVLRHPTAAGEGDRSLPSFAVRVEASDAALGRILLETLRRRDDGAFPWVRLVEERRSAHPSELAAPPRPSWIRRSGPARTLALAGLFALLFGLWPLLLRRPPSARAWWLRAGVLLILAGASAWATDRLLGRWIPPLRARRGPPEEPPEPPPPGHVGVYALGGSTLAGEPYYGRLSPVKVVAWLFGARGEKPPRLGEDPAVFQNLATSGRALSVDPPDRILSLLADPERFRPRAILLYVGHNEVWRFREEAGAPEDPEAERAEVEGRYERAVRAIALRAREARALLVIALPAADMEGMPPEASLPPAHLSEGARRAFDADLNRAWALRAEGDAEALLHLGDRLLDRSPGHALATWLRARALERLGRRDEALKAYRRAVQIDAEPRRARPSQNRILERICAEGLARCIDVERLLRGRFGRLDDRVFADLHHPRAPAVLVIGQAFADALAAGLGLPAPPRLDPERPPPELDVSDMDLKVSMHTAHWMLTNAQELQRTSPHATAFSLARSSMALDDAQARDIATDEEQKQIFFWRAALQATRGDAPSARRWLRAAVAPPRSAWLRGALADPWNRRVFARVGIDLAEGAWGQ